jgi:hypothetical protein
VDQPPVSQWTIPKNQGRRPIVVVLVLLVVVVAAFAGIFVWLFNSPGFRVAQELYTEAPAIVTQAHYSTLNGGADVLTILVARDVTRDEALTLQCQTILPLLERYHLAARVVIEHPDGAFELDGVPCPSKPVS